eukprot:c7480_g1_i2.p1 GENE.c7480_g1_i2~~c7480_g1_i2.p1  ORF type:complete len:153 (-),score=28.69 c7480_g1_i2:60-518(-)
MSDEPQFTPEQTRMFKELFDYFDRDHSGYISFNELRTVMRILGKTPTNQALSRLMKEVDHDGNGEISEDEFLWLMARDTIVPDSAGELRKALEVFDYDGSGTIRVPEFRKAMLQFGEMSEMEVDQMISSALDLSGSRDLINIDKFVDGLTSL